MKKLRLVGVEVRVRLNTCATPKATAQPHLNQLLALAFTFGGTGAFLVSSVKKVAIEGREQSHLKQEDPECPLPAGCVDPPEKPGSL